MARTGSKWVALFAALVWGLAAEETPAAPQPQLLRYNGSRSGIQIQPESQKALELSAPRRQVQQPSEGEADPRRTEANRLFQEGWEHYNQTADSLQAAIERWELALALYREVDDRGMEAIILISIGEAYYNLGQGQEALNYYQQALPIHRETGNRIEEGIALNSIGLVYDHLGQRQEALDSYQQALSIWQEVDNRALERILEADTLHNIGLVYDNLGRPQEALDYFQQALSISRELDDRAGEGITLSDIGFVYDEALGQPQEALNYFQQALSIHREVNDRTGEAYTLVGLGGVYNNLGQPQEALNSYQQALSIARELGERPTEALTLYNLARNYRDAGDRDTALTHIEESIEILEELRSNIASSELRTSYFATVQDYYSFYIDLLMELHEEQPEAGYDALAFHASEGSRARSLIELMAEANIDIRRGISPELADREADLLAELNFAASRRQELLGSNAPEAAIDEIRNQIQQLETELQQVEAQIRQTSPEAAALKYPQPLTLVEVQERVLDEDTVLLQYSLGEERSFVWVVTPDDITSIELPNREEIARLTTELRWKLTSKRARMEEIHTVAAPLSDAILAPIGDLGNKRLLIVADGILQTLPFSALAVPSEEEYIPLLVNHEIVQSPSSSLIGTVRQFRENRPQPSQTLAMIADPVFGGEDDNRATVRGDTDSVRSGCYTSIPERLLGTAAEANAITELVSSSETLLALEYEARRELMLDDDLSNYRIVHLATHGCFDENNPRLSAIALSRVDEAGNSINGNLWLNDIYNLNLPAELVVLSACQTALGDDVRGEGIVGLTRGFFQAGTSRLIASLWNVDDASTARLMEQFYQNHLDEGMTPSQALRSAQLQMWENEADFPWQKPYYWSAFIFQGEWR